MSGMSASQAHDLSVAAREVEEFVAAAGWDQPPQLFALVPTAELVEREPDLAGQVDQAAPLTPVAQEALADTDLAEALGGIMWPDAVHGCALAQEIVVLPQSAEAELPDGRHSGDSAELTRIAAAHPQRQEARIVAAVLRDGTAACVLRLRGDATTEPQLIEHPELAPNLTDALLATLH